MLTVKQVLGKEIGDAVPEFQGTVDHVFDYKTGKGDDGNVWSFQGVILIDAAGEKIELKLKGRQPVPAGIIAVYAAARPSKKDGDNGKLVGLKVGAHENKKRIENTDAADIRVTTDGAGWTGLAVIEQPKPDKPAAAGSGAPAPVSPAPGGPAPISGPAPVKKDDTPPQKPANGNGYVKPLTEYDLHKLALDRARHELDQEKAAAMCLAYAKDLAVAGKIDVKAMLPIAAYFRSFCQPGKPYTVNGVECKDDRATGVFTADQIKSVEDALGVKVKTEIPF